MNNNIEVTDDYEMYSRDIAGESSEHGSMLEGEQRAISEGGNVMSFKSPFSSC